MKRAVHDASLWWRAWVAILAGLLAWPEAAAALEAGAPMPALAAPLLGEARAAPQLEHLHGQVVTSISGRRGACRAGSRCRRSTRFIAAIMTRASR